VESFALLASEFGCEFGQSFVHVSAIGAAHAKRAIEARQVIGDPIHAEATGLGTCRRKQMAIHWVEGETDHLLEVGGERSELLLQGGLLVKYPIVFTWRIYFSSKLDEANHELKP
jgi:hypothetical protein